MYLLLCLTGILIKKIKVSVTSWRSGREFWASCQKKWHEIDMSCDSTCIRKTLAFLPPGHPAARGGDSPFAGQAAHADGGKVWAHLRPLRQLARHAVHESSPLQLPVRGELCPVLSSYQYEKSFALFSPVTSMKWALPCSPAISIKWSLPCSNVVLCRDKQHSFLPLLCLVSTPC